MINLKDFIEKYSSLSNSDWQLIQGSFRKRSFQKNDIILEYGNVCRHFYFLESGLIRFYNIVNGEDFTKTFTIAPFCFTSKISFRKQMPSPEGIQALEEVIVWETTYQQYMKLEEIRAWNIFISKIKHEIEEFFEKIHLEAKTMSAEVRYQKLHEEYPASLIQKIPLKHLASFLGIAPQSLSRIRKRKL